MTKITISLFAGLFFICFQSFGQIDLDKLLEENEAKNKKVPKYTEGTFRSSHIIHGHSIEGTPKGILDFRILHRFGTLNKGIYEFFGLDNASMRMGFNFGITDRLSLGVGRSTFQKQYDGFLKYAVLRQKIDNSMPLSASYLASGMLQTLRYNDPQVNRYFTDRLFYAHQLILARKFSKAFSLQLMPTVVHYNVVPTGSIPNDLFSVGVGTRLKVSQMVSLTSEYYYQVPGYQLPGTYNSLSFGIDIETAGHVFQLHLTNSTGMTERTFITGTTGSWGNGDILFGFNISRKFELKKQK